MAAGPYSTIWNNSNNDIATFGSTAGAVSVAAGGVNAGGLTFTHTTGTYSLTTNAVNLSSGAVITGTVGGGTISLATVTSADSTFRFRNSNTANNLGNANLLTFNAVPATMAAANNVSVEIQGNAGTSTAAPVVFAGTIAYTGTTTVADRAVLGLSNATLNIVDGSITMGVNSTLMRTGGSLGQGALNKIAATTNAFTIVANNAGTANALNLTNFPNARLAVWDNVGTQSFGFTGAITAGSNGYLFGSSRAGNTINIGGYYDNGGCDNQCSLRHGGTDFYERHDRNGTSQSVGC